MTKKSKIQFIAEIGLNHNGNFDNCYQLIKSAKEAGADICKFQLGWRYKKGELNYIDEPTLKKIISLCEFFEIELLFSVMNLYYGGCIKLIREINQNIIYHILYVVYYTSNML